MREVSLNAPNLPIDRRPSTGIPSDYLLKTDRGSFLDGRERFKVGYDTSVMPVRAVQTLRKIVQMDDGPFTKDDRKPKLERLKVEFKKVMNFSYDELSALADAEREKLNL